MITLPVKKKTSRDRAPSPLARGFSLIEVLMAIFILGIGMISIAALFPAGMVQQRQSADDIIGPLVANNALAVIRRKVKAEDFGTFEEFGVGGPRQTIRGDWTWLRPGFIFAGDDPLYPLGAIDLFSAKSTLTATEWPGGWGMSSPTLYGIPYNRAKWEQPNLPTPPPVMVITQQERYYPQTSFNTQSGVPTKPQYVWDCAFRRFQGKILVAVFVYRVTCPGGGSASYAVAPNASDDTVPPLPIWLSLDPDYPQTDPSILDFSPDGPWDGTGPNDPPGPGNDDSEIGYGDDHIIWGTASNTTFDPNDERQGWQAARQWILDQDNRVHRVLSAVRFDDTEPVQVELARPLSLLPNLFTHQSSSPYWAWAATTDAWYIPLTNRDGLTLTPVYLTVKEL